MSYAELRRHWTAWAIGIADSAATEELLSDGANVSDLEWRVWSAWARIGDMNQ